MVEKLDSSVLKTPMTEAEVMQESAADLSDLKFEVKNQARFEKLLQDPTLQRAFEKLFDKMSNKSFWKEWEKLSNIDVHDVLKNHKSNNVWLELYADKILGLEGETIFKNMNNRQKLNFMAFDKALKTEKTTEDVLNKTKELQEKYINKLSSSFSWNHITNFLQLKKTLKEYWLTETEIQKIKELVDIIDMSATVKNAATEYIVKMYGPLMHPKMLSASVTLWGTALAIIIGLSLVVWWLLTYVLFFPKEKEKPVTINSFWTTTEMKEILEVLSYQWTIAEFTEWEAQLFDIQTDNWFLWWKKPIKRIFNKAETREIKMFVNWEAVVWFDVKQTCLMNTNMDDKWNVSIKILLPEPKISVRNTTAQVVDETYEAIKIDDFKHLQETVRQQWIDIWVEKLKENWIIEEWKKSIKRQFESYFRETYRPLEQTWIRLVNFDVEFISAEQLDNLLQSELHQDAATQNRSSAPQSLQLPKRD